MTGIFNVIVRANLHGFVFRVFIRCQRRKRRVLAHPVCGSVLHGFDCRTPSLAGYSCPSVTPRRRAFSAPERVEGFITDAGKKPSFDDEDAVFRFWFIFRFAWSGRDNNRAIVLSQRLITVVDDRLIAIGLFHCALRLSG